jgi:iron(II)-dependent oxidoreductase
MSPAQTIADSGARRWSTRASAVALTRRLRAARERTLLLAGDIADGQLLGPKLAIVNPPLWEFAHVGWFQEFWCLRYRAADDIALSMIGNADALYNSALVPHTTRWELPLLPFDAVQRYLADVLLRVEDRLQREPDNTHLHYFAELAAAHEEMHDEAFTYTRQTLGYAQPRCDAATRTATCAPYAGDAAIPGGEFWLGATRGEDFVFDNEKWAHRVLLAPFAIARAAVTNEEFAAFVDAGGYRRRELWCMDGWQWRQNARAEAPVYWVRESGQWLQRRYDQLQPVMPRAAVIHVNWYEADAWCRWAGRRLPTEAEWEQAAATKPDDASGATHKRIYPWGQAGPDAGRANLYAAGNAIAAVDDYAAGDSAWGCRQMLGNVWEWTADWFNPYPGFERDPYKEYSQPWFGNHKVLRGGCFASSAALLRNTWRNFYTPDRRDVFAGFRTCAV